MNIGIIGGDLRIIRLAQMYAKENNKVYTYGLEKFLNEGKTEFKDINNKEINQNELSEDGIVQCDSIRQTIDNSEIVISGMPFSKYGIYVNSPFSNNKITVLELKDELFSLEKKAIRWKYFFAGGIPESFNNNLKKMDTKIIDLLQNEKLTILNAIATVEGTIRIAIQEREEAIFENNVLICGFGRIGKIMCDRFKSLGANVYCAARKENDLTWIRERRYIPLTYDRVSENGKKFDLVINTVPTLVLKEKELNSFKQDVLIIDVASNPGGIDKNYAMKKNIKVITALGIPGKEMPKTAARFIKEFIQGKLKKTLE